LRAVQVIDEQRAKLFANVAPAVDGSDPEGVHDMRVATRRLRACLTVFTPWLDPGALARISPAVRTLTRALGRVRELDVLRLRLADLATTATPQRALAIECVDARLARRRSRARARMMARFAKVDLDRLQGRLHRLTVQLARPVPAAAEAAPADGDARAFDASEGASATDPPIADLLAAIAGPVLEEARDVSAPALSEEIGTASSAEALHAVRIAAKKLRYTLEIVAPYLGGAGPAAVKKLRAVQDRLGDFHDDTVLDDTLRPEIERALERGRPLLAGELRALRASRRRALLRDERAVRREIAKLHEDGFVALLAGALEAAGVTLPSPSLPDTVPAEPEGPSAPDETLLVPDPGSPRMPRRSRAAAAHSRDAS